MGLSIAYQLSLPPATDRATVVARVTELRERALRLPVKLVTDMMECQAGETLGSPGPSASLEFWFRSWAALTRDPEGSDELPDATGFIVCPGDECEPAAFGLARVPAYDANWSQQPDAPRGWWWHSVTKTQYASIVSAEHFVRCHAAVVALLDAARELGFDVQVVDEGGYWESRDGDLLLASVDHMNQLVAGIAGTLYDRLGPDHPVDAPIFAHPDFERLETRIISPPP
jgi:hypothetical protein